MCNPSLALQVCEFDEMKLNMMEMVDHPSCLKCGTFQASDHQRRLMTGNATGKGHVTIPRTNSVSTSIVYCGIGMDREPWPFLWPVSVLV